MHVSLLACIAFSLQGMQMKIFLRASRKKLTSLTLIAKCHASLTFIMHRNLHEGMQMKLFLRASRENSSLSLISKIFQMSWSMSQPGI